MIDFNTFKNVFTEHVYCKTQIPDIKLKKYFNDFSIGVNEARSNAAEYLNSIRKDTDPTLNDLELLFNDEFLDVYKETILYYMLEEHNKSNLDVDGYCLKNKILNQACCMRHDKNLLGIVRGFDEMNTRFIIVDFGGEKEVKIDIDEIIIAGVTKDNA